MAETADIVVVGAGIIGLCAAMQIARRSKVRVVVIDKGHGPGEGSTGASSAVCRHKYSRDEMIVLARDGIWAYRNWRDFVGLSAPLARYHRLGVLWFGDGSTDGPNADARRLRDLGVSAVALDDLTLRETYPALNPCTHELRLDGGDHICGGGGAHLLETDGGYVDPVDALQDLIVAARALRVDIHFRRELTSISIVAGRVKGVTTADGARIDCDVLINAAGPWCRRVLALAGIVHQWPLEPTRIQVAHVKAPADLRGPLPVCGDMPGGIYFRTQNGAQQILVGSILPEDEQESVADPDDYANHADEDFVRAKLHLLQHRIPSLSQLAGVRSYSGLYTMNQADVHPVVGKTPVAGFLTASGFSGHGFKIAPAIGALLAQEVVGRAHDFDTDVSADFLSFFRRPIKLASKSVLA